ncbi:unnamed protein product [Prunus armeniaca]
MCGPSDTGVVPAENSPMLKSVKSSNSGRITVWQFVSFGRKSDAFGGHHLQSKWLGHRFALTLKRDPRR